MNRRYELHDIFKELLGSDEVYFQPPASKKMSYPAIIYDVNYMNGKHANNSTYSNRIEYSVTIMYTDPDFDVPKKIFNELNGRFNRHFVKDGLIHDVINLYY